MLIWIATTFFVYILFWAVAAFIVLPFGIRTHHDEGEGEALPGHDRGAPTNYRPWRFVIRTTVLASVAYAAFYANYVEGWVTLDDVSMVHPPASFVSGGR